VNRIEKKKLAMTHDPLHKQFKDKDKAYRASLARLASEQTASYPIRNDPQPQMKLLRFPIDKLRLPERNERTTEDAHVTEVANSIAGIGNFDPILVDQHGNIVNGVVRYLALKSLGRTHAECLVVESLSGDENKLRRTSGNRLQEKGSWDLPQLVATLADLKTRGVPMQYSGFEPVEIDTMIYVTELRALEVGSLSPDDEAIPIARPGDVFCLGKHRLVCGPSRDPNNFERLFRGDLQARAILTDQPFNLPLNHMTQGPHKKFITAGGEMSDEEFDAFNLAWIGVAVPHLIDGGIFGTFIDWRGLPSVYGAAASVGLKKKDFIVSAKTHPGNGNFYLNQHELMPLFKKGNAPHINNINMGDKGRRRSNLWPYAGAATPGSECRKGLQFHPTVKPTAMLEDALADFTHSGDIVLDPFLGSGSTLIACERKGRICRGIEMNPRYIDVIIKRYQAEFRHDAVLEDTGETFAEVTTRRQDEALSL
jgi:DNA modification methylase